METKIFLENLERKKKSIGLIHRAYLTQIKNSRKYLASTKTKSEVRGGGRKPWKQKGTGRARAGSSRSPLWVGGGVSFGPKFRIVHKKINKKENRLAILSALYLKKKNCRFVEETIFTNFEIIKTKKIREMLLAFNFEKTNKILFILNKPNRAFWLATRNFKNIEVTTYNCLNIRQLLQSNYIILSNSSLEQINLTYGQSYL
jgi:large subunit ribosomal protein L4